jgi:tetratricopeptide (TPR) repeat protein
MTALLVYQAYETLGNRDSASLWLSRIPLSNTNYRINAIVFLQRSGLFGRADSMIAELPSSFARDTLTLRRMVFAGYLDSALHYSVKVYAAANNSAAFVWQLRAFLFAGKGAHADSLLEAYDTAALAGNNDDVLDMRFAFTTMRTCPAAWVTYGSAACAAWQGNVARVYELLKAVQFSKYPASVGELLILTCLGTLEEAKKYVEARELMERISLSAASPEFRYRYADILELTGDSEKARALLEALLSVNPDDVYSEKARLRLREKSIVH